MKIALVHHAEKKTNLDNPELTTFGIQQSKRAAQFVAKKLTIEKIYYTQTARTKQSALPFQSLFPKAESIVIDDLPQEWNNWCQFAETHYKQYPYTSVFLCHHTTLQMCKKQFQLSLSLSSHSSVIILERTQENVWNVVDVRQGEISL